MALYHVLPRDMARLPVVFDVAEWSEQLDILREAVSGGGMAVRALWIMPNDYHMLCVPGRPSIPVPPRCSLGAPRILGDVR